MPENGSRSPSAQFEAIPRREHLPDEIARTLGDQIADGTLGRGARLPAESALATQFGVSRNVIREAIARLKYDGLIETRQGLGAFVANHPHPHSFRINASRVMDRSDLQHVLELRMELEVGAAGLAALRRTDEQIALLRQALGDIATAIDTYGDGVPADADFHYVIAQAANNPYYRDLMVFLADRVRESIEAARTNTARYRSWTPKVQKEHERICEAIEGGDPEAARQAVRQHLFNAARRLGITLQSFDGHQDIPGND